MNIAEFFATLGLKVDDGSFKRANSALDSVQSSFMSLRSVAISAVGGFGLTSLVKTIASYEGLKSTLVTTTGSVEAANQKFKELQAFADETPFSLAEATQAFNHMKAVGLDPTIEKMRAFGDAAAMRPDRSFLDLIMAIADGTQGMDRRLRDFGLNLEKSGAQMKILYGGEVVETVKNNAKEIEAALMRVSTSKFGGAMERQAKTLSGIWSTLQDKLAGFAMEVGEGGFLSALKDSVTGLTKALVALKPVARVIGTVLATIVKIGNVMVGVLGFLAENWRLVAVVLGVTLLPLLQAMLIKNAQLIISWIAMGAEAVAAGTSAALAWLRAALPLVLLILLLDDIWGWFNGKDSLIGAIIDKWGAQWTAFLDKLLTVDDDDWWIIVKIKEAITLVRQLINDIGNIADEATNAYRATAALATGGKWESIQDERNRIRHENEDKSGLWVPVSSAQQSKDLAKWTPEQYQQGMKAFPEYVKSDFEMRLPSNPAMMNDQQRAITDNRSLSILVQGGEDADKIANKVKGVIDEYMPEWLGGNLLGPAKKAGY